MLKALTQYALACHAVCRSDCHTGRWRSYKHHCVWGSSSGIGSVAFVHKLLCLDGHLQLLDQGSMVIYYHTNKQFGYGNVYQNFILPKFGTGNVYQYFIRSFVLCKFVMLIPSHELVKSAFCNQAAYLVCINPCRSLWFRGVFPNAYAFCATLLRSSLRVFGFQWWFHTHTTKMSIC